MIGVLLMILGAAAWLAGELTGVFTKRKGDTTSEGVWWLQKRWPWVRIPIAVFVGSLFFHFLFGWWLLP